MEGKSGQPTTIDEYIAQYPEDVQQVLLKLREVIKEAAPGAVEKMSYNMPGYFLNGGLVWFSVWKRHIGFYPRTDAIVASIEELSTYKGTKGSVHFPLRNPALDPIRKIVQFRVAENLKQ
jgi:uncharacterized protein YdhG (YjbR/CyaY superfamily)